MARSRNRTWVTFTGQPIEVSTFATTQLPCGRRSPLNTSVRVGTFKIPHASLCFSGCLRKLRGWLQAVFQNRPPHQMFDHPVSFLIQLVPSRSVDKTNRYDPGQRNLDRGFGDASLKRFLSKPPEPIGELYFFLRSPRLASRRMLTSTPPLMWPISLGSPLFTFP